MVPYKCAMRKFSPFYGASKFIPMLIELIKIVMSIMLFYLLYLDRESTYCRSVPYNSVSFFLGSFFSPNPNQPNVLNVLDALASKP